MSRQELLAFMPGSVRAPAQPGLEAVPAGDYVAFFRDAPGLLARAARKRAIREASARARALEALLPLGTVLPVMPNTVVPRDHLPDIARANATLLDRLTARLENKVQFQVRIDWDATAAPARFGVDASERHILALRRRLEEAITTELDAEAEELQGLPLGPDGLSNHVILLDARRVDALDRAARTIDAFWTEGLAIHLVGPSPAVSFATITLERQTQRRIAAARELMGLASGFAPEDLRAARRSALLAAPGAAECVNDAAECLDTVLQLPHGGTPYLARVWSEGRSSPAKGARAA